jgi:hypothetical protein
MTEKKRGTSSHKIKKKPKHCYSFKIPKDMYNYIADLIREDEFQSISEFLRFSFLIFLHDTPDMNLYIPKFFALNFYDRESEKTNISVKIPKGLRKKLVLVKITYKTTFSELARVALDYASDYFLESSHESIPSLKEQY